MTATPAQRVITIAAGVGEAGTRLDRVLADGLVDVSRSRVKALIEAGAVSLGGETITDPSYRVKRGQNFAIILPEPVAAIPLGQSIALDIVFEDSDVIVIDKPAGLVVHPAPGNPDATLVNALIAHCGSSLSGIGGVRRPGIVHRLDKDTSGLIVAAKNDQAHQALATAFARHEVERAYLALVWGVPSPASGEIAGNIGRHPTNRRKMAVVARGGKPALTRFRVRRAFGLGASLVECRLATGRTHQIRVHMAKRGNPVIGDPLYGGVADARIGRIPPAAHAVVRAVKRQALHAWLLGFRHPRTGIDYRWESELPADFRNLIHCLEGM